MIGLQAVNEISNFVRLPFAFEAAAGIDCLIPAPDVDGDGIFDDSIAGVDTDPFHDSNDAFDDNAILKSTGLINTTGTIDRGQQTVVVFAAVVLVGGVPVLVSGKGVEVGASPDGGSTPATIEFCDPIEGSVDLDPGDDTFWTCENSSTVTVVAGPVDVTLFGDDGSVATVSLGTDFGLTFDPEDLTITAPLSNPGPITVTVNGVPVVVPSGSAAVSLLVAFDPVDIGETELELGQAADDDEFEIEGTFTLGDLSNGIGPLTEGVSLRVGTYSVTIPATSFELDDSDFKFEGDIDGVTLEIKIEQKGDGAFKFKIEGQNADLNGTENPVEVGLGVGDDGGTASVTAEFEDDKEEEEEEEEEDDDDDD